MKKRASTKPFRSAKTEIKQLAETGIPAEIPKLAFMDADFLLRREFVRCD